MNKIAQTAKLCEGVVLGDNIVIEDDVYLDYGVIVRDNVWVKKGSRIGARCILGEYLADFYEDCENKTHPLVIGENALIRSETIIYGDTIIGHDFQTGHRVTVREKTEIGHHVRVGTLSDIQGHCKVGNYVNMHSNVHVGHESKIGDYVWIFPYVVLTNDPTPPSEQLAGVTLEPFCVICTGSLLLPGVRVGEDALVGAGSVVTRDVEPQMIAVGNPAKAMGPITKIHNKFTQEQVYPWRYTFDRGMPWKDIGYQAWQESRKEVT